LDAAARFHRRENDRDTEGARPILGEIRDQRQANSNTNTRSGIDYIIIVGAG
jgi:hypothetical protein